MTVLVYFPCADVLSVYLFLFSELLDSLHLVALVVIILTAVSVLLLSVVLLVGILWVSLNLFFGLLRLGPVKVFSALISAGALVLFLEPLLLFACAAAILAPASSFGQVLLVFVPLLRRLLLLAALHVRISPSSPRRPCVCGCILLIRLGTSTTQQPLHPLEYHTERPCF